MTPRLQFDEPTHTYRFDGEVRPSVTQVMQGLSQYGIVPADVLEAAQKRGTRVHSMCQFYDECDLDESSVAPEDVGYLHAWIRFRADTQAMFTLIEKPLYSTRYGFAGTPDRFGVVHRTQYVLDIKTTAGQPHRVWGIQTAAYRALIAESRGEIGTYKRATVQLRPDGTYLFHAWNDADDWPAFLSLINLRNWSKQ